MPIYVYNILCKESIKERKYCSNVKMETNLEFICTSVKREAIYTKVMYWATNYGRTIQKSANKEVNNSIIQIRPRS